MNSFDLATARLRLVSITGEMMDACTDTERLAYLLAAEVPASWPPEHWEPHVYGFMKEQVAKHPHTAGWNRFVLLHGERSTLIGTICGFPRTPSEAEIGYSLLEAWQRQGYATEGVRAFVAAMLRDDTVQSITAQTFPQLSASIGVLRRCGFVLVGSGDEEGSIRYRLQRSAPAQNGVEGNF